MFLKSFISILPLPASPGPVGNMTVTSPSVDQLTVTWTPPTTGGVPTSYNVTINDSSSPVVIADNGSPVYTHTFTELVSDTLYTVSMVAINCAGASNAVQHHRRTCKELYCTVYFSPLPDKQSMTDNASARYTLVVQSMIDR